MKTFSGGMQRRLNLVCGLLHDPPVILLDEPTVGVDPQSRNAIFESIERLKREGRTILYTTHYMEEAERLCDRVAIIDHGRILALDTVAALLDAHGGPPRVEIEFPERPASLDERGGTWHGSQWTVVSDRPEETLRQAIETGQSLRHVTIDRPTLESVFLHLTGRTLRD